MKKILGLVAGLMLVASLSLAADASPAAGGMYVGLGAGLDFPGYNWWSGTPAGLGGEVFAGYSFDRAMAVQLDVDGAVYSYANGNSTFDLYFLPEFKYTFDNPGFQPYLLAGAGLNLSFDSGGGISTSNGYFAGVAGLGVQFDLGGNTSLFVETKLHMAFVSVGGNADVADDYPLTAGVKFPL
ncbi:MAG TPA: outer membrane beta-barrel protein [bacterium]|jgi:hypothetical protein|nr:outer membrane beta-barrel protein [bacterium]